ETTDASGFYNIPFPPDDYVVRASAPGYTTWTTWLFSFSPGVVWANATLWPIISTVSGYLVDSLDGSHVTVLGLRAIASRAVYAAWYYGSDWAASNATGSAVVDAPAGATTYVSAWATGYVIWSSVLTPAAGSNPLTVRLYPDLPQDVRIRGYVTDAVTNASVWPATTRVTGYDDQTPYEYVDGTGYYEVWTVAAPQTVRATATGHAAGEASADPVSGETLWVNLTLAPDTNPPLVESFTATPSIGVSQSNPSSLVAHVNETSLDQSYLSILKLYSVSSNVGTFLILGRFYASRVSVTQPTTG